MAKKTKRINGEGSVYAERNQDGKVLRWVAQLVIGTTDSGYPKKKKVSCKTKSEAVAKLEQLKFDAKTGILRDTSNITIHQLGAQMEQDRHIRNEISDNTFFRSMETLKRLNVIADYPIQEVTPELIQKFFLSEQMYSQSTLNKEYILLGSILKEAKKRGIISENPMDDVKKPRSRKQSVPTRALTVEEQQKLLQVLQDTTIPHRVQMLISLYTGMRIGEVHALEVQNIDFKRKCIRIRTTVSRGEKGEAMLGTTTKTKAGQRTIPLTPQLESVLKQYIGKQKTGLLFTDRKGQPLTTNTVNCQLQRILKKYDIQDPSVEGKLSAHSLRHSYATRCIEAGMMPKVLQKLLGHTDVSITLNTYCDVFQNYQAESIEKFTAYMAEQGLML